MGEGYIDICHHRHSLSSWNRMHGSKPRNYSYNKDALWKSEDDFNAATACNADTVKGVVVVQDFDFSEFELYTCNR